MVPHSHKVKASLTAAANGAEHGLGTFSSGAKRCPGSKALGTGDLFSIRAGFAACSELRVLARLGVRGTQHRATDLALLVPLGAGCSERNLGDFVRAKSVIMSF